MFYSLSVFGVLLVVLSISSFNCTSHCNAAVITFSYDVECLNCMQ